MGNRPKVEIFVGTKDEFDDEFLEQHELETFTTNQGEDYTGVGIEIFWTDWESSPEEICLADLSTKAFAARDKLKEIFPEGAEINTYINVDYC